MLDNLNLYRNFDWYIWSYVLDGKNLQNLNCSIWDWKNTSLKLIGFKLQSTPSGPYYKQQNQKTSKPMHSLINVTFWIFLQIYPHKKLGNIKYTH